MKARHTRRIVASSVAAIAVAAVGAPVASAVPIEPGTGAPLYKEWTQHESLRLLKLRQGKKIKKHLGAHHLSVMKHR